MRDSPLNYAMLAEQAHIAAAAHKAYERVVETLEDARLAPPRGADDRSLRLHIMDYFETAAKKKKSAAAWNALGVVIFAAILLGQARLELQLLHHFGVI